MVHTSWKRRGGWAKEAGWYAGGGKIVATKRLIYNQSYLSRVTGPAVDQALQWKPGMREEPAEWQEAWKVREDTEGHEWALEAGGIVCWKGKWDGTWDRMRCH